MRPGLASVYCLQLHGNSNCRRGGGVIVANQVTKLAGQIILFAKRAKLKDDEGHNVDEVQAALALVQMLARELPKLVVKVEKKPVKEDEDDEEPGAERVHRLNGRASVNGRKEHAAA